MPQGYISLNIENGITIFLMILLMYFAAMLVLSLVGGLGGGGSGVAANSNAPGFSWSSNINLAA